VERERRTNHERYAVGTKTLNEQRIPGEDDVAAATHGVEWRSWKL
jgi:hypothetical protein